MTHALPTADNGLTNDVVPAGCLDIGVRLPSTSLSRRDEFSAQVHDDFV